MPTSHRSDLSDNAPYVSRGKGKKFVQAAQSRLWVSFLRSASVVAMRYGALHQITTGTVCNNSVDQSVPHRSIRNHNIYTPSAPPGSRWRKEATALPMRVLAQLTNDVVNRIAHRVMRWNTLKNRHYHLLYNSRLENLQIITPKVNFSIPACATIGLIPDKILY